MSNFSKAAIGLMLLCGLLRFGQWGASLTSDEAYTLRYYANQPVSYIVSHYEAPNNHVLLSVLLNRIIAVYPKKLILSFADIRVLQLPGILASIATLLLLYHLARGFFGPQVALLATTSLGVSFWHLLYSHMLRGYSLSAFFNLLNVYAIQQILIKRRYRLALLLPPSMLAAHYLMPVNALFTVALLPWVAAALYLQRRDVQRSLSRWRNAQAKGAGACRRQDALSAPVRHATWVLGAALLAGVGCSIAAYAPIVKQVMKAAESMALPSWSQSLGATDLRLDALIDVLGSGRVFQVVFLAIAAAGFGWVCLRRRWAEATLALSYLTLPLIILTIQKTVAPTRVFVSTLPIWAMLFALGFHGALILLRRRLSLARLPRRTALAGLVTLTALLSLGQIVSFLGWHKGIDLRLLMKEFAALTRDEDDFAIIMALRPRQIPGTVIDPGPANWEYYGLVANILPYHRIHEFKDYDYMAREKYYIAALSESDARAAMEQNGLDPFLQKSFRHIRAVQGAMIYQAAVDSEALDGYRKAAAGSAADRDRQGQALAGLGQDAIRRGDIDAAVRLLTKAKSFSPANPKVRFSLGMAHYLAFDDPKAAREFEWLVEHDTANLHARLYLAGSLAGQGRFQAAIEQFSWYGSGALTPGAWLLQGRAKVAIDALRGSGWVAPDFGSAEACAATARAYRDRGELERAARAMAKAARFRPLRPFERAELGGMYMLMLHEAKAAELLRAAVKEGAGPEPQFLLLKMLVARFAVDEARVVAADLLRQFPQNEAVLEVTRYLDRM